MNLTRWLSRGAAKPVPEAGPPLSESVEHEARYLNAVLLMSLVNLTIIALTVALIVTIFWLRNGTQGWPSALVTGIPIDPELAAAALAVLATVAVALQVSVRSPSATSTSERSLGRQLAIEQGARFTGLITFVVPVLMFLNALHRLIVDQAVADLAYAVGALIGATLISAIAIDAGQASASEYGTAIEQARKERAVQRLQDIAKKRRGEVQSATWWRIAMCSASVHILAILLSTGLIAAAGFWRYFDILGFGALAGTLSASLVLLTIFVGLARGSAALGDLAMSVYWMLIWALLIVVFVVAIFTLVGAVREGAARLIATVLLAGVAVAHAWLQTGKIPAVHGRLPMSSIGFELVTDAVKRRQKTLATRSLEAGGTALRMVGILILAALVPPVGLLSAIEYRRVASSAGERNGAGAAIVISALAGVGGIIAVFTFAP